MKCKKYFIGLLKIGLIACFSISAYSCKESLPSYVSPEKVISISVASIEQLNDHIAPPNRPLVRIVIQGENIYDEVFWDSVEVKGSVRIWWKRKPVRFRTLYLTEKNMMDRSQIHNDKMMLLPGQRFALETYWNVRTDNGMFLPNEMDFTFLNKRRCDHNVACGTPEDFVVEVTLQVYSRLGYLTTPSKEFIFRPRVCVCSAFPPCNTGGEC